MDKVVEARIYSHQPGSGLSTGDYMHSHRHSRCWHIGYKKKHARLTYTYIIEYHIKKQFHLTAVNHVLEHSTHCELVMS